MLSYSMVIAKSMIDETKIIQKAFEISTILSSISR